MKSVHDAFRSARIHAYRHMDACERAGLRWGESAITEVTMARAAQAVAVVPFTQRAESLSGADWVWWWVDGASAYGMLVQAKRLAISSKRWAFDFGYVIPSTKLKQRDVLRSTAAALELCPAYALYLGTGDYRDWARCSDDHQNGRCLGCVKRAISVMPALLAEEFMTRDADSAYERSVALEDLWSPSNDEAWLSPVLETLLAPDLLEFLQTSQDGTRAVGRALIDRVLRARSGAFSAAPTTIANTSAGAHDDLGPVFSTIPDDAGHWGSRYFDEVLSPLRHVPPDYVLEILSGDFDETQLASRMPENVGGIVVVSLPSTR